jgi:hypothetical protein
MSLLDEGGLALHPNVILDLDSIARLPEPEVPRLLKDIDVSSLVDRIDAALKRDNDVWIDFDFAVRLTYTQREVVATVICIVMSRHIADQPVDETLISTIHEQMIVAFKELCELETAPGVFPDVILATCAELRLRSGKEPVSCGV